MSVKQLRPGEGMTSHEQVHAVWRPEACPAVELVDLGQQHEAAPELARRGGFVEHDELVPCLDPRRDAKVEILEGEAEAIRREPQAKELPRCEHGPSRTAMGGDTRVTPG